MATKKRLIYLDDIKDALRSVSEDTTCPVHIAAEIDQIVELAPTVDAVEVVHGRWVNPYMNRYGHPCHCCSICGFTASYQDKNYCPNCGAKIDGDCND